MAHSEVYYWADRRQVFNAVWVEVNGESEPLPHRGGHSPTGFNWGYGGSGPADLAWSIILDATERGILPDAAKRHVEDFKWDIIARLPDTAWTFSAHQLQRWWERVSGGAAPEAITREVA